MRRLDLFSARQNIGFMPDQDFNLRHATLEMSIHHVYSFL